MEVFLKLQVQLASQAEDAQVALTDANNARAEALRDAQLSHESAFEAALSEREELEMHGRGSYSQSPARSSPPQRIIMGIG